LVEGKDQGKGAPMSCAMIYWNSNIDGFFDVFTNFGAVVDIRFLQGKTIGDKKASRQVKLFEEL
jgi:hypothetical protein